MIDNMETTGEKIKKYRLANELTQKQLAEMCDMYESQIRKYETGKANPKIQTLSKIASALKLPVDMLRSDSELSLEKLSKDIHDLFSDVTIKIVGEMIDNKEELFLLGNYRKLNQTGKRRLIEDSENYTYNPKYTEPDKQ